MHVSQASLVTTRYSGLYFQGQISIMSDSNPIFRIVVYATMVYRDPCQLTEFSSILITVLHALPHPIYPFVRIFNVIYKPKRAPVFWGKSRIESDKKLHNC